MEGARCWTDCHNHLHLVPGGAAMLAEMAVAGVGRCVVNATCEAEWAAVAALAEAWPGQVVPAFGIHPWRAAEAAAGWEARLRALLDRFPGAGVGECGLDGAVAGDRVAQDRVFRAQVRLAREAGRVLMVHAVRAWEELSHVFAEEPPPERWLLHGYGGSLETARVMAARGAWFSGGAFLLEPRRAKALEVFRQLPPERMVLETDAGAGRAAGLAPAGLPRLEAALAGLLGEDPDRFAGRMERNAVELLG